MKKIDRKQLWSALFVGVFCLLLTSSGFSQGIATGSMSGTVKDSTLGTIKLELGQVGDTIQVEGGTPLIETGTSQVTTSFSTKEVADLPLSGSFDALALFIPGVADSGDNSFSNNNGASFY